MEHMQSERLAPAAPRERPRTCETCVPSSSEKAVTGSATAGYLTCAMADSASKNCEYVNRRLRGAEQRGGAGAVAEERAAGKRVRNGLPLPRRRARALTLPAT